LEEVNLTHKQAVNASP